MQLPDDHLWVFTAEIEERNGSSVVEIPEREVSIGELQPDGAYRIGVLSATARSEPERETGLGAG